MNSSRNTRSRRRFLGHGAAAYAAASLSSRAAGQTGSAPEAKPPLKLGLDNFSVRAMGWKAEELIDYAANLKVDALLLSDLDVYRSHEAPHLAELRQRAADAGVELHAGTGGICPTSERFDRKWGSATKHLQLALRVAAGLGSPVVRCYLGFQDDRYGEGGIRARIADTVQVCQAVRPQALDSGIRIAVENHAGDMQAWELQLLIERAGPDFVGATVDAGNAAWTLEAPLRNLEVLGPHLACAGIRDSMLWETDDGFSVQWTAMGDGLVDLPAYARRFAEFGPEVPFILEIISGFAKPFPIHDPGFWRGYPEARAADLAGLLALAKKGTPIPPFRAPDGPGRTRAEGDYQRSELEKSLRFCRETLGLGRKT
ncbi:MAG TPA: sugar phosphate isomerase/epimerase [Verrucomicrobiales bacterium]|nr:sugar phosphate isomerase/epimerase [Verrucomicrobiales bacterium]